LILDEPKKSTLKVKVDGEDVRECTVKKFLIGDQKGKKALCFVEVNYADSEDVADADAWNADDEMILFCGKALKFGKEFFNSYQIIYLF